MQESDFTKDGIPILKKQFDMTEEELNTMSERDMDLLVSATNSHIRALNTESRARLASVVSEIRGVCT